MIAFRISSDYGDYYLDVPTDISVTLTVSNAFFDIESIQRAFSYDFVLQRTPRTDAQLQHLYRLDASRDTGEFSTEMLIMGQPYEKGILLVESVESGYRLVFKNKNRAILDQLDAPLSSFLTPISLLPPDYDARWRYKVQLFNFQSNTGNYVSVTINGQTFGETVQGSISNPSNWGATFPLIAAKIKAAFPELIVTSDVGGIDIISETQLQIVAGSHTQIVNVVSHTPESQHNFIVRQIQAISNDPNSSVIFPTIIAPNLYNDDKPTHYTMRIINEYDEFTGEFMKNTASTEKQAFANTAVPMMLLRSILLKIVEKLGLTIGGEWINLDSTKRLFFVNTVTIDDIAEITTTTPPQYFNQFKISFLPSDHLPDITAKELLREICSDFGLVMQIQANKLILTQKSLRGELQHWTSKLVANKIKVEPGLNQGVKLHYNWGDTSKFQKIPNNYAPLSIGKGEKPIQLNFNTLLKYYERDHVGLPLDCCWFWGKNGERPKTLLLHFGRNTSFGNYPYASSENIDYQGNILNEYSFALSGSVGRYQTHLKGIVEYQNARTASAIFNLTLEDLQSFQRGDYGRIIAYTPQGELRAAIKDMTLKIKNNIIEPATLNLLRL